MSPVAHRLRPPRSKQNKDFEIGKCSSLPELLAATRVRVVVTNKVPPYIVILRNTIYLFRSHGRKGQFISAVMTATNALRRFDAKAQAVGL